MGLGLNVVSAILIIFLLSACSLDPCCGKHSGTSLQIGESRIVTVHADKLWNDTSILVEPGGEYAFSVINTAIWYDASIPSTANGYSKVMLAPFAFFRRDIGTPWFALVCTVDFKDKFRVFDNSTCFGSPPVQACAERAEYPQKTCRQAHGNFRNSGTLYCYANDASFMYGNNNGVIEMTVTKKEIAGER
jgi:hypothetical protein